MSELPDTIKYNIYKYYFKYIVLQKLSEGKPYIPYGDFGALRRYCIKSPLCYYTDIFKSIENYIENMNNCSNIDKKNILDAMKSYETNINDSLYQSFPFKEWINQQSIDGGNYGYFKLCITIISQYYLYPDKFKNTWNIWVEKYC